MSATGQFVPGIFSQVGRITSYDIENLKYQLHLDEGSDETPEKASKHVEEDTKKSKSASKATSTKTHSKEESYPRTPGGELAKAIQEKLSSTEEALDGPTATKTTPQTLTASFTSEGINGRWTSKMAAMSDINALNRRNETHPPPAWYKLKHDSVIQRPPSWDIGAFPITVPRPKPSDAVPESSMAFLTSIDLESAEQKQALTARQRAMLRDALGLAPETSHKMGGSVMSLATPRGDLSKVGRTHVLGHEVSCAYDSDLLEQDIKGYPKLRYPQWDFDAYSARPPLIPEDSLGEPGKYDVNLDSVKPVPKNGVGFGKALPRSTCVSTLGYIAPPAVLHPEHKRTRGLLPDRSTAKNSVRKRITHVNDFDRELARPPLLTGAAQTYHDDLDPAACEAVFQRELTYDADTADIPVTHRRDIAVAQYARMLPRGRDAVQGVRSLSHDLAVRGAVGMGFVETKSQKEHSTEQREARSHDSSKRNPNIGPSLDFTSLNKYTDSSERIFRGKAPVAASGIGIGARKGPLRRNDHPILKNAFKRSASQPGFESRSKFGGTRDILGKSRSSIPLAEWSPTELDDGMET